MKTWNLLKLSAALTGTKVRKMVVSYAESAVSDAETVVSEPKRQFSAAKRSFRTLNGYEDEGVRKSVSMSC